MITLLLAPALAVAFALTPVVPAEKHRGVSWVAGGHVELAQLERVAAIGGGWIAETPFGWMPDPHRPELRFVTTHGDAYWGESDEGLAETARLARRAGLRTLLKPHLWLHGSWPGEIAMTSEEDWAAWFESYERFLLHHAELAECEGFDMLVVGTELKMASRRAADWRRLIARVREVYHGPLTYAANWDEVWSVPFWDALDAIGVNAYFPLDLPPGAAAPAMDAAWRPIRARLEALANAVARPVLFAEIGYRADPDCLREPWAWHRRGSSAGSDGTRCQAEALESVFRVFWDEPWFLGLYVWKWFPAPERMRGESLEFSPQGRPAEQLLIRRFRGLGPQRGGP